MGELDRRRANALRRVRRMERAYSRVEHLDTVVGGVASDVLRLCATARELAELVLEVKHGQFHRPVIMVEQPAVLHVAEDYLDLRTVAESLLKGRRARLVGWERQLREALDTINGNDRFEQKAWTAQKRVNPEVRKQRRRAG